MHEKILHEKKTCLTLYHIKVCFAIYVAYVKKIKHFKGLTKLSFKVKNYMFHDSFLHYFMLS